MKKNRFFNLILKIISTLFKSYLFIFFNPIKIVFTYMFTRNRRTRTFLVFIKRFFILPFIRIYIYIFTLIVIKPSRYVQYHRIFPFLLNSSDFLNELETPKKLWLTNPKYMYKYLLYNKDNKYYKFLDPMANIDNFFNFFVYKIRFIIPTWRLKHMNFFYPSDYHIKLYKNSLLLFLNKVTQAKILESFKYVNNIFILLYRHILKNLKYDCLFIIYKFRYNIYYKTNLNCIYKLLKFLFKFTKINKTICFILYYLFFYFFYLSILLCILCIKYFVSNRSIIWYYNLLSLDEDGSQKSSQYSYTFGFSGNLLLEFGDFFKSWDLNLNTNWNSLYNRYQYMIDFPYYDWYNQSAKNKFDRVSDFFFKFNKSNQLLNWDFFGVIHNIDEVETLRIEDEIEKLLVLNLGNEITKSKSRESFFTEEYSKEYSKEYNNVYSQIKIPNERYKFENIKEYGPGFNVNNSQLYPIEDVETGSAYLNSSDVKGVYINNKNRSISKYRLNNNPDFYINKYILKEYDKRYKFYLFLYKIFGNYSYYFMKFLNYAGIPITKYSYLRQKNQLPYKMFDFTKTKVLVLIFLAIALLESFFFIYYIIVI